MKTTSVKLQNNRLVFISLAETLEEDKQLQVLVRETRCICSVSKKTGLYIVAEMTYQERKVVAMSVRELILLTDQDLRNINDEVLKL